MTIKKMDYEWADDGSKTQPSDAKIAEGWVGGDRPSVEYFNWLDSRQDDKLNRIISERVDSFLTDATDPDKMITTGIWSDDWGSTASTDNYIDGGSAKQYVDIKPYFNSDGDPRLLVLDMAARKIEIWNPRSIGTVVRLSQDLATDMVGGDTYFPVSMCTDGTYVFVVMMNDTDNTAEVNCWTIDESSSTWSNPWAAEVTLNGSHAVAGAPTARNVEIIIANDNYVATGQKNNTITAASTVTISILAKSDGTIATSGSGDATTGAGFVGLTRSLVSDGTNIFFGTVDATPDIEIASCTIADATAGSGIAGFPLATATRNDVVLCGNGSSIVSAYGKAAAWAIDDTCIRSHKLTATAQASCDQITIGQTSHPTTPVLSDVWCYSDAASMCFDGINFWVINQWDNQPGDGYKIVKMDASKFTNGSPNTYRTIETLEFPVFLIAQDVTFNVASDGFMRCIFDGRDIWVNVESRPATTPATAGGRIYRLPLALLRS